MDRKSLTAVAVCVVFLLFYPQLIRLVGLERYYRTSPLAPAAVAPGGSAVRGDSARSAADTLDHAGTSLSALAPPAPGAASSGRPGTGGTRATRPGVSGFAATTAELKALTPGATAGAITRSYVIETPLYRASFSNRGARLLAVELLEFESVDAIANPAGGTGLPRTGSGKRGHGPRVVLAGGPAFELALGSGAGLRSLAEVAYAVEESTDAAGAVRVLRFVASDSTGFAVRQTWRARPNDYALDLEVEIRDVPEALRVSDYTLLTRSWPLITEVNQLADERGLRASSLVGTNVHREHANSLAKGPKTFDGNAAWAAVQSRYFLGGVAILSGEARGATASSAKRALTPAELATLGPGAKPEQDVVMSGLIVGLPGRERPAHHYLVYFGPSGYFRLAALKVQFERAVDMGWSWILPVSKILLKLLNWLNAVVKNYGVAILALATLVRVVLHPLNLVSMRSMRAMQKLQPEMERIKEKYKNDAAALNTATMALYKDNKVNPASGCLPMLLQMPLFLALYQVLFNAIELRRAPFVAWMQDLSAPDLAFMVAGFPIRVLPVLMAGSGLLQQMVTPTDPRQRSTMYMMNVVMLVFFYSLPSGLVLYWTVMNLLTALQQWMVLRQDGGTAPPAPVLATVPGRRR